MQLFLEIPYFVGNPVSLSNLDSYIFDIVFKSEIQAIAYIFQNFLIFVDLEKTWVRLQVNPLYDLFT